MSNEFYTSVCLKSSMLITKRYSTSFSLGIRTLEERFRMPIYAIYGFVRFADEIVDTFNRDDAAELLQEFKNDTYKAIDKKISLNPVLHSFQLCVNTYGIEKSLIDTFLHSMEMDLSEVAYDREGYETYILGSAEVVGLMCLRVFCEGNNEMYQDLKPSAMKLGAAFQKINFLRDLHNDYKGLGRVYFPHLDMNHFDEKTKASIEQEIEQDFIEGLSGIRRLPKGTRFGVYVAYVYYYALLRKINSLPPSRIMEQRIRIPNAKKYALIFSSYFKHSFNLI